MPSEQELSEQGVSLSDPAMACLRRMVSWCIVANPTLRTEHLDRTFGRGVWEEVSRAGLIEGTMYGCHELTAQAVHVALDWPFAEATRS